MPYIITTRSTPEWSNGLTTCETRRAVATLDEARADSEFAVRAPGYTYPAFYTLLEAAQTLTEAGGTIGPLPDGTVIEVEPMECDIWHDESGIWGQAARDLLGPFDNEDAAERAYIDAYNAQQERAS